MFRTWTGVTAAGLVLLTILDAAAQPPRDVQNQRDRDDLRIPPLSQQRREPMPLGCWDIQSNADEKAAIRVDVPQRRFDAVLFEARGATIRIYGFNVITPRGRADSSPARELIQPNRFSTAFPLSRSREIREVQIDFSSTATTREGRRICAWGIPARLTARGGEWREIGCHTVDFRGDLDNFRVGRDVGEVSRVRIDVREGPVRVNEFEITYFGDVTEPIPIPREGLGIPADRRSQSFELKQGPRRIREIKLNYRSIDRFQGRAIACVEGFVPTEPERPPPIDISKVPPPEEGWERFACQAVDAQQDSTRLYVGRNRGRFSDVRVEAYENGVRLLKFSVLLERDGVRDLQPFRVERDRSYDVALRSRAVIESISLTYQTSLAAGARGRAIICVSGRLAEPVVIDRPPGETSWRLIGCQPVQTSEEYDIYSVRRDEGPFQAIRFIARRDDVDVFGVRVRYDTGQVLEYSDRDVSRPIYVVQRNRPTEAILLPSTQSTIRTIGLRYRTAWERRFNEAVLCIEGLPGYARDDDWVRRRWQSINGRQL